MICCKCRKDFDPTKEPGAVVVTPPLEFGTQVHTTSSIAGATLNVKIHICRECFYGPVLPFLVKQD